jgi:group II intron reverse transcriptase/maturase
MQTNVLIQYPCRLFSQKIPTKSATVGVLSTRLTELIRASKNKDGRYGNLIKIISSVDTLTLAYLSIKKNSGNMTKGLDNETLDGIDKDFFKKISKQILEGSYKFSPVRRVEIPKPGKSGLRPLGVSSPRQKIVQKAMEMVFSLIFEDIFLDCSHGFRPGRSCHTALHHLQLKAGNVSTFSWVIEGDIKGCFDNIPHSQIIKGINRRIDCPATTNLVKTLLSAGYVVVHKTKTPKKKLPVVKSVVGTPQGTVLSPLFCNIVLHELDYFIMNILSSDFEMGKRRRTNPAYSKVSNAIKNAKTPKQKRKLANIRLRTPSIDPMDKNFKRIHYVRYADDWVIFVCGSYNDANLIKNSVSKKLKNLGLALNLDKSVITHLRKQRGKFLGFEFFIRKTSKDLIKPVKAIKYGNTSIRKRFSPRLILHAPIKDLLIKLVKLGFAKRNHLGQFHYKGKASTVPLTHPQILQFYNSKVRNLLNYYSCAHNRMCLWSLVRFMKFSCALSLARKFKLKSMAKTFKKFGSSLKYVSDKGKEHHFFIPKNLRILPMKERFNSKISFHSVDSLLKSTWYKSMTNSQLDEACVICGTTDNIEIHHLRSVKNVRIRTNTFAQWKGGFLRKSIPLCSAHHLAYHNGQLTKDEISIIAKYRGK